MMWPRQGRSGQRPRKNVSAFGKGGSRGMQGKRKAPATEPVEESNQDAILDVKLVTAQTQPRESSSGIAVGISGECSPDTKKPRLLEGENATGQGAVSEDSEDSDGNSDGSDLEDFTGDEEDETGSGTSGSSDEEPCAAEKDISKGKPVPESDTKRELSLMSFEELLQLRNNVGTKTYQQMISGKKPLNHTKPRTKQRPSKQG